MLPRSETSSAGIRTSMRGGWREGGLERGWVMRPGGRAGMGRELESFVPGTNGDF